MPPLEPMLAKAVSTVPHDAGVWSYEPKWDGFRALVFRDGDDVVLQSRNGKELARYFPELLDALACGDKSLMGEPFRVRRQALSELVAEKHWCHVTRTTEDPAVGVHWLTTFEGAGLDGVIAKRLDGPYLPGKRDMMKIKHARDADCVAIGYRIHKSGEGVGSILLGLYRDDGELEMIGGAASFTVKARKQLLADLEPLRKGDDVVNDGEPSRWNSAPDKRWIPVQPEKVAEVAYDQMEGDPRYGQRFRHAVRFVRWRPDREPSSCTFDQLDAPLRYDLYDVLES